ncbi:MAG: hypothetical protein BGO31_05900 [Bacteroidetes bacterium 43-16]|nr:MAG: hypothetical protein BGO31_05900 [Bacteroidetes bacterium 43-16]
MKKLSLTSFLLCASFVLSQAQGPFFLDPNFGQAGVRVVRNAEWTPQFGPYVTYKVWNMLVGNDDKIILGGNIGAVYSPQGVSSDHVISRLLPNGKPDSSFNGTGHLNFSASNQPDVKWLDNMVLLPDNKILYAGNSSTGTSSKIVIYKINANGTFDNQFGTNGAIRHQGPHPYNNLRAIATQSNGKIIALTNSFSQTASAGVIMRLNANGIMDNTFGNNGSITPNLGFSDAKVLYRMIKVLEDNSFIVVGTHTADPASGAPAYSAHQDFVAKFNADGVLQTSFGTNGKTILPKMSTERLSFFNKYVDIDQHGDIYVNCSAEDFTSGPNYPTEVLVYKLQANGSIAYNYGQDGRLPIPGMHADNFYYYDACIQNGDQLLLAAMMDTGMDAQYMVKRLNADGSNDLTFAGNSAEITGSRAALDHFHFIGLQSNNKIIVGGYGRKQKNPTADTLHPVLMRLVDHKTEEPVDSGTAIVPLKEQDYIKVFPNPAGNYLYIRGMKADADILLFDISGKAVMSAHLSGKAPEPLDCSVLAPGIYWLHIKEDLNTTVYTHKLIKQ